MILLVISNGDWGGAQSHLVSIARRLMPSDKVVCLIGKSGPLEEKLREIGVETLVLPMPSAISPYRDLLAVYRLRQFIKAKCPALIHVHSSKAGFAVRLASMGMKVPVIYTAHGWGFKPGVPVLRRLVVWISEYMTSFLADRIICVSEYDLELARRYLPFSARKFKLIKNGIEDCNELPSRKAAIPRIVMVSRFQEPKLQSLLIDAFLLLRSEADLWLVGDGPELEEMKQYWAEKQSTKTVVFWGGQSNIAKFLANCDMFVLLSEYEGFPISILEAMRAGLPVVASAVGGIPEQISDGKQGLLVASRRAIDVAEKLDWLIENPKERAEMGRQARIRFEREFSEHEMWHKTRYIYQDLVG